MPSPPRPDAARRALVVLGSALLLAPRAGARAAAARQDGPRLETPTPRIDLGTVALGADPTVVFPIRNAGAGSLTLTVGTIARGLKVVSAPATLGPGETGAVRLVLDTFRVGTSTDWTVALATNDPARTTAILQVHADVRTFILIDPPASRISYVQYEREGGTTHLVAAAGHADFRVLRVESPYPFIDAAVEAARDATRPEGTEGPLWRVSLTIRRDATVGPLAANVVLHTNHPTQPRAWLPVSGFVRPSLAATPPTVEVPVAAAGSEMGSPVQVIVTNFAEATADLAPIESTLEGIATEVTAIEPGRRWRVTLRARGAAGQRSGQGVLRLRTTRRDVPPLEVALTRR